MPAQISFAAGAAPGGPAAGSGTAGVHGAERGRGEGGEHARMGAHRFGDVLAAGEPGADELVGVAAVGLGAGGADRGAAVPAGGVEHLVRQRLGVQSADDFTGGRVDVADGAVQPDRADAATRGGGPGQPGVVVVTGGAVEQFVVEGPYVRSGPRAGVDEHGGQGQRRDTHPAARRALRTARGSGGVGVCMTVQVTEQARHW